MDRNPSERTRSGSAGGRPRTGTEPVTARSPLRLRRLLSSLFLPLFAMATALFAAWAAASGAGDSPGRGALVTLAAVCAALAVAAAVDLLVVSRRLHRERVGRR
ncbi:DUF6343 family protein [Streptomyces sp. NPDC086777]|uniref:DUF6343 family protein n=1 Tax=Streptomyces sp. NPDC086777 TaxID=3154866 RepID=UPI00344C27BD